MNTKDEAISQLCARAGITTNPSVNTGTIRWLQDGSIIEFTDEWIQGLNRRYNINGDPDHQIWFTQLNSVHFTPGGYDEDWKIEIPYFELKELPGKGVAIYKLNSLQFSELVRGRKFRVHVTDGYFTINSRSSLCENKTFCELIQFIKNTVYNGDPSNLGDLVKCMRGYTFKEV